MNTKSITYILGWILKIEAAFMSLPILTALIYGEEQGWTFVLVMALCLLCGALLTGRKPKNPSFYAREAFVATALGWIAMSVFGCIPFVLTGEIPRFIDALFETVSGFTTTGASIMPDVEIMSHCSMIWRCFTHWIGGMGVLVFLLAVLPMVGGTNMHLMKAESPGPSVGKMTPTIRQTSRALYKIYVVLTVLETLLLVVGGMPLFDSVVNALATAGTGGFAIKNASIAAYPEPYFQAVIAIFMALFGVNFNIYYLILLKNFRSIWKNEELRAYLGLMLGATIVIGINILPMYHAQAHTTSRAFLDSFFQVASIMTTTGFATADFNLWPQLSRLILVLLMFFGASAGSTGGGIKISRMLILGKHMKREMLTMLRPRSVHIARMDGKTLEEDTIRGTSAFLVAYCAICMLSMLLISLDNFSMETTVTSVISCINNIGPGLDMVGPTGNFSQFSVFSKLVLSLDMLFGRLEIFPMLLLFSNQVWKKRV